MGQQDRFFPSCSGGNGPGSRRLFREDSLLYTASKLISRRSFLARSFIPE